MGKLRFGVAFAVTGKEVERVTFSPDPTASSGQAPAFSPRERGQRGRDKKRGFPGGGRKRKRGIPGGCKGKLSGIRHSRQSDEPLGRR